MIETQLADEALVSRPPAPRGQRAGGPHAPESITTIGQGVVIEGDVKGGEDFVIDGQVDGTIELPEHVLTVGPTGRVTVQLSAKSVVVLGKVEGSIQASELVRIGETGSVEGAIAAARRKNRRGRGSSKCWIRTASPDSTAMKPRGPSNGCRSWRATSPGSFVEGRVGRLLWDDYGLLHGRSTFIETPPARGA